jgi:hypothetical protein
LTDVLASDGTFDLPESFRQVHHAWVGQRMTAMAEMHVTGRSAANRRRALLRLAMAPTIWQACPEASAASAPKGSSPIAGNRDERNVIDFGADATGQSDSTEAFRRAIAASQFLFVPAGRFVIGDLAIRSGFSLRGIGPPSELLQRRGSRYGLWCDSGSPVLADNLGDIRIQGLHLRGLCDVDGFSEHRHLLNLNGVSRCVVDRVSFTAFCGDAILLGSSNRGATERHNQAVTISACTFDGVNHQNRNGISVIDCDGLTIEGCSFMRTSRPDMPGAIDLEPDANAFHVLRNVRIANNRFADIGGNVGVVSLVVQTRLATPAQGIVIRNNEIRGARRAAFCLLQRGEVAKSARPRDLQLADNTVLVGAERPFHIEGVDNLAITGNRFVGCLRSALVGYVPPALGVTDLTVLDNRFEQCGSEDSAALRVHQLVGGRFERNQWVDCGNGSAGAAAIELATGQSASLSFENNAFSAPHHLTRYAIRRSAAHRTSGAPGTFRGNRIDAGMLNDTLGSTAP